MKKIIFFTLFLILLAVSIFFYLRYQVYSSVGKTQNQMIEIVKGQGAGEVGEELERKGIISNNIYFNFYVLMNDVANEILPGSYYISSGMTIPEIVQLIVTERPKDIKITFPEGWTIEQMAERLSEKGFPGDEFLELAESGESFEAEYTFLQNRTAKSLEGYLFPDTYFFLPEASAENIVKKMLDNFGSKVSFNLLNQISDQGKTLEEIVIMASIIEKEVNKEVDRKIVSGIFWSRIEIGQALQSCATLAYILGENKEQYSLEDTRIDSLYNTYLHPGLPPGPINNPGLSAILAATNPQNSSYLYFLNDPKTGTTVFSDTLEGHNANKQKYGL